MATAITTISRIDERLHVNTYSYALHILPHDLTISSPFHGIGNLYGTVSSLSDYEGTEPVRTDMVHFLPNGIVAYMSERRGPRPGRAGDARGYGMGTSRRDCPEHGHRWSKPCALANSGIQAELSLVSSRLGAHQRRLRSCKINDWREGAWIFVILARCALINPEVRGS